MPDLEAVLAPVGGGGLLGSTAIVAKELNSAIGVFGVEPSGADDAARSFRSGRRLPQTNPRTIADGLRASVGEIAFTLLQQRVDDILTVSEESIVEAMRLAWQILKVIIEPSSAVVLSAVLTHSERFRGKRVGLILSGGNVDIDRLPWMVAKS